MPKKEDLFAWSLFGAGVTSNLLPRIITPSIPYRETFRGSPALTADELKKRISSAINWLSNLYQYYATYPYYAYQKEYPACPLSIYIRNTREWRFAGDRTYVWVPILGWKKYPYVKFSTVSTRTYGDSFYVGFEDSTDWDYDEPLLFVTRDYYDDGKTITKIKFIRYGGSYRADVYFGDYLIFSNVGSDTPEKTYTETTYWSTRPAHRYTVRHAAQVCEKIYKTFAKYDSGYFLRKLIQDFGFTYDIYDSMFKRSLNVSVEEWGTKDQFYHDCDVYTKLPKGMTPHRYPYWSKVCYERFTYMQQSVYDPLIMGLRGIHVLNVYNNPDHIWSPRLTARTLEKDKWNGYGIGHPMNKNQASAVRTAVFLVLETLLGYKYGDTTSKGWADSCAAIIMNVQWGEYPYAKGRGVTEEVGASLRPQFQGSFFIQWVPYYNAYRVPSMKSWIDTLDFLGLEPEEPCIIPSNTETTALMLQALRVYLYYKFGVAYPNALDIP